MIEIILSIVFISIFYLLISRNNILLLTPSNEKMNNVYYFADDINDCF